MNIRLSSSSVLIMFLVVKEGSQEGLTLYMDDICFLTEKRVKQINELNSHLQMVINQKDKLISRLQQPYVGDFIKMDVNYKKWVMLPNRCFYYRNTGVIFTRQRLGGSVGNTNTIGLLQK